MTDALKLLIAPEALGWTASLLTLLTFICADMRRLRLLALAANAAFIAYGSAAELLPVLVLHLSLVPVNLWRLNQAFSRRERAVNGRTESTLRPGRRPSGWNAKRRSARVGRRQAGSAAALSDSSLPRAGTPRHRGASEPFGQVKGDVQCQALAELRVGG